MAASSSFGRASRREAADCARVGNVVPKVDRCVEESIIDLCERFESACRERSNEFVVCLSDSGSVEDREERESELSRER
jgi:hypothetical protein